jgi:tetratricopeptide (TPR) repeat protein
VEPIKHILEEIAKIPSHLLSQASAPQIDNFIPEKKAFIKYVEEGNKYYNHLNYQPPQKVNAQAPPTIIDLTNDETKQGIITFAPNLINPVSLPEDWNKINAYLNSPPEVEAEYWIAEGWTYYEQQNYDLAIKMYQAALSLQGLPESYREFIINSINSIVNISKTSSQPLLVNTKADTAAKTPVLNPLICCSIFSSSSPTASTLLGKRKYEEVQKPAALDEVLSFSSCKKG